ncbi:hypothetical protein RB195_010852 [Necator americanus]|uniref:Uncharacterized protein n=1 Tax=Necator americanus TaxID=51031 RepID=A0ABR1D0S8_NECAM
MFLHVQPVEHIESSSTIIPSYWFFANFLALTGNLHTLSRAHCFFKNSRILSLCDLEQAKETRMSQKAMRSCASFKSFWTLYKTWL